MLLGIGLIDADILVGERTEGSEQCCFVRVSHCHTVTLEVGSIIERASYLPNLKLELLIRYILLPP